MKKNLKIFLICDFIFIIITLLSLYFYVKFPMSLTYHILCLTLTVLFVVNAISYESFRFKE